LTRKVEPDLGAAATTTICLSPPFVRELLLRLERQPIAGRRARDRPGEPVEIDQELGLLVHEGGDPVRSVGVRCGIRGDARNERAARRWLLSP